jgi:hypothetical protein
MYTTKTRLDQNFDFAGVIVKRQNEIYKATGSVLDVMGAVHTIREHSKGFSQSHEKALEADALLDRVCERSAFYSDIEGFTAALEFSEGDDRRQFLEDIEGFKTAIEFI